MSVNALSAYLLFHGPVIFLALVIHPPGWEVEQGSQELRDVVALVVKEDLPYDHVIRVKGVELHLEGSQLQPGGIPVGVGAVQLAELLGRLMRRDFNISLLPPEENNFGEVFSL